MKLNTLHVTTLLAGLSPATFAVSNNTLSCNGKNPVSLTSRLTAGWADCLGVIDSCHTLPPCTNRRLSENGDGPARVPFIALNL